MQFFMPICYIVQLLLAAPLQKTLKKSQYCKRKPSELFPMKKTLHIPGLFSVCKLKILPYDLIIKQSKLQFMHSIRFKYAPESFNDIWTLNANREHEYQLRNNNEFVLIAPRIEFVKKQPIYSLPNEWNALGDLRFQHNMTTFRIGLKYDLLSTLDEEQN